MRSLVLVLSLYLPGGGGSQWSDSWASRDKLKHFFVSAFVQSVSYSALRTARVERGSALAASSALTLVVGVGKEVHDKRSGENFSVRDLAWDAAGAGAAAALLDRTR
ncbi:MAG TPA: hypothetical protein VIQ74_14200 [Gemmatimonadaceae bacterium]